MIMKNLLFICFLGVCFQTSACLNHYHSMNKEGKLVKIDEHKMLRGFNINFNVSLNEKKLKKIYKKIVNDKNYQDLSDYAVRLLNLGKTEEALTVFQVLQRNYPNEYQLSANLGTAYELMGELDSALKYIKNGIALNKNAHDGSEWVHVKILETKIKLLTDSTYLESNTVLSLTKEQYKSEKVLRQIEIQLRERFPFCGPPNRIMSDLIMDLGDCYAQIQSIEKAKALYTINKHYYLDDRLIVDDKINEMIKVRIKYKEINPERGRGEKGMNIKLSGIRYKDLLDNNNPDNIKPKFIDIELNTDSLLSLVGLSISNIKPIIVEDSVSLSNDEANENDTHSESEENGFSMLLIIGGCVVGFLLLFFIFRKKSN